MERVVIDTAIFALGMVVGYLVGNQVYKLKEEEEVTTSTVEPTKTAETTEPAKKKKSKKVVLTPSVA